MKKTHLILIVTCFSFLITSCSYLLYKAVVKEYKMLDNTFKTEDGFEITIDKIVRQKAISEYIKTDGATGRKHIKLYNPGRNNSYYKIRVKVKNTSTLEKVFNFKKISVIDIEKELVYKPKFIMYSSKFDAFSRETQVKIKPQKNKKKAIAFAYSKTNRPTHLIYGEQLIKIPYKK